MTEDPDSGSGGRLLPAIPVVSTKDLSTKDQGGQPADDAPAEAVQEDAGRELVHREVGIFANGLEPTMERTSRYVIRHGLLVVLAVRPFYKALHRLSMFLAGERIPFRPPLLLVVLLARDNTRSRLIYYKPQLVLENGKLICSLSVRGWLEKTLSLTVPRSLRSRLKDKTEKATKEPVFHADLKFVPRAQVMLVLTLISILGSFVILLTIPWYVILALGRGLAITFRSALRTIPSLFALLIVIFITADAWKMFGLESNWRFAALLLFMGLASIIAVIVSLRETEGDWRSVTGYSAEGSKPLTEVKSCTKLKSWAANKKPASKLVEKHIEPFLPPPPSRHPDRQVHLLFLLFRRHRMQALGEYFGYALSRGHVGGRRSDANDEDLGPLNALNPLLKLHEKSISVVYFITIVSHVVAVAFWISLTFVVIGAIAVTKATTNDLLQRSGSADTLTQFNLIGQQFIVSRQLVLISLILGGIATLTFVSTTLQDADHRRAFADYALTDFRRAIGGLAYYYGAVIALFIKLRDAGVFAEFRQLITSEGISDFQSYVDILRRI